MGWISDDLGRHEGYVVLEFADGYRASSSTGDSAVVMLVGSAGELTGQQELRPHSEVVGWRVLCDCIPVSVPDGRLARESYRGRRDEWTGRSWTRVASSEDEDLSQRRVYADLDDPHGVGIHVDARDDVATVLSFEWRSRHVDFDPNLQVDLDPAIIDIRAAAAAEAVSNHQLNQAVALARIAGCSWARIGRAYGISRQSAHKRWGQ